MQWPSQCVETKIEKFPIICDAIICRRSQQICSIGVTSLKAMNELGSILYVTSTSSEFFKQLMCTLRVKH